MQRSACSKFKFIAFSLCIFTCSQLLNAAGLADRVLILVNDAAPPENGTNGLGASVFVGQYYANARGIPPANILHLSTSITEGMTYSDYLSEVESPVRAYLSANNNKMLGQILYIVPAYGVPVKLGYAGGSLAVDSVMAGMMANSTLDNPAFNPYTGDTGTRPQRFDAWSDGRPVSNKIFIVTRLDGPSATIAKGLVDKAIGAEISLTRQSGTGYFDAQGTRSPDEWQYAADNEIQSAADAGTAAGFPTVLNLQRNTCGAMIHPAAVNTYDAVRKSVGILPPGATARMSLSVSAFSEGTVTVKVPAGGIAATTPCNTLTFYLTTDNPANWVQFSYPIPPFASYDQTTYMSIVKVVGGAVVASNDILVQADAALLNFTTLRFDIRKAGVTVMRDNATLIAMTDAAATPVNYTGVAIYDKSAYLSLNGLTVANLGGAVLWNDDFSTDSRSRYQWTLPGLQGTGALWVWGWNGSATDSYRFVPGAVGAQFTSYTALTIRTPYNPDPAVAGLASQRWGGAWVPMMLEEGITATWGAVDEPYANYYPRGGNVFDHIWAGYNFGESFAIAQRALGWRIVAVGDPLYAPAVFRAPVAVKVTPASATLVTGRTQQFAAEVTGGTGNSQVTWSISPATGSISTTGVYTAPSTVAVNATVVVKATSVADPAKSNAATVSVLPAVVVGTGSTQGVIWQDPVSGLAQIWFLGGPQGTSVIGAATLTASNTWRIVGVGDFNRDGQPDVVWQDPVTGAAQVWFLGGAQGNIVTGAAVLSTGNSWRIMSIADFDGDGRPDCIWQDPVSGQAQIWFMGGVQGASVTGALNLTASNSWRIAGTGDFNQDGHPDVLWQDPVSGATQVWYLGGAQGNVVINAVNLTGANSWRIASVTDFNGDGHPDVVWQDPVSGASQVWFLGGPLGTTVTGTAGLSGSNAWRIAGPR